MIHITRKNVFKVIENAAKLLTSISVSQSSLDHSGTCTYIEDCPRQAAMVARRASRSSEQRRLANCEGLGRLLKRFYNSIMVFCLYQICSFTCDWDSILYLRWIWTWDWGKSYDWGWDLDWGLGPSLQFHLTLKSLELNSIYTQQNDITSRTCWRWHTWRFCHGSCTQDGSGHSARKCCTCLIASERDVVFRSITSRMHGVGWQYGNSVESHWTCDDLGNK